MTGPSGKITHAAMKPEAPVTSTSDPGLMAGMLEVLSWTLGGEDGDGRDVNALSVLVTCPIYSLRWCGGARWRLTTHGAARRVGRRHPGPVVRSGGVAAEMCTNGLSSTQKRTTGLMVW